MRFMRATVGEAPTLSVVMPVYNTVTFVGAAIESVLRQIRPADEIIVVDDGSTDGSSGVLELYRDRVTVVHQRNAGSGAARNAALAVAHGDYIVMLDSDDVLMPWALSVIAEQIAEHGWPSLVMSRWYKFDDTRSLPDAPAAFVAHWWPDLLSSLVMRRPLTMAAAVRSDVLHRVGGFVAGAHSSEDIDLWLRIGTHAGFVYLDGGPLYGYRQRAQSTTHSARRLEHGIGRLIMAERRGHYPGGRGRSTERRRLLTRNVVWGVERCWSLGDFGAGMRLLVASLPLFSGSEARREGLRLWSWWIHRGARRMRVVRSHARAAVQRAIRPRPNAPAP